MEYYILEKDGELQVVSVTEGSDPLYGYGSWNLYSPKPFSSWSEAFASLYNYDKMSV